MLRWSPKQKPPAHMPTAEKHVSLYDKTAVFQKHSAKDPIENSSATFEGLRIRYEHRSSLPHTRGDEPNTIVGDIMNLKDLPRTSGMNRRGVELKSTPTPICPTSVGMNQT